MSIPDLATTFSRTPQVITTDAVSEHVNSHPNDAARRLFVRSDNIIRVEVAVAAAGMASGIRFEFRIDTAAGLASGNQLVLGDSGILLPAVLLANTVHEFRIKPIKVPAGYDVSGVFYNLVSEAASGGFAVYADLRAGSDSIDAVDSAP